MSEQT
ncbi:hypothetical protein VULLAG_LOCUS10584 [Vulpes lagopus]